MWDAVVHSQKIGYLHDIDQIQSWHSSTPLKLKKNI
jgi:hypothetical protein